MASVVNRLGGHAHEPVAAEVALEGNPGVIPTSKIQEIVWGQWHHVGTGSYTSNRINFVYPDQERIWHNNWYITANTTTTAAQVYEVPMQRGTVTYNTTFTAQQNYVWSEWQYTGNQVIQQYRQHRYFEDRTPEEERAYQDRLQGQREAASRRRLEAETRQRAANEQLAVAHERGMELLEMILTDEEKLLRAAKGGAALVVRGNLGGLYEIDISDGRGVHGNVTEVDEHGCRLGNICVAPKMYLDDGRLPLADGYVGQYLSIKHDEETFRNTGNWSFRRVCAQPGVPILGQRAA